MDVVLSQKDADWIANIIRRKMTELEEALKDGLKDGNDRYEACKKIADMIGIDPDSDRDGEPLSAVRDRAENNMRQEYMQHREEYERILYLLMAGSY